MSLDSAERPGSFASYRREYAKSRLEWSFPTTALPITKLCPPVGISSSHLGALQATDVSWPSAQVLLRDMGVCLCP